MNFPYFIINHHPNITNSQYLYRTFYKPSYKSYTPAFKNYIPPFKNYKPSYALKISLRIIFIKIVIKCRSYGSL